jgi:hypothetical protein
VGCRWSYQKNYGVGRTPAIGYEWPSQPDKQHIQRSLEPGGSSTQHRGLHIVSIKHPTAQWISLLVSLRCLSIPVLYMQHAVVLYASRI